MQTGASGVTASDHSTGLSHAAGLSDIDVINLSRPCRAVRLYYLFGVQGAFHVLPPVTVPVRQVAVTDGGPWAVRSPAWVTSRIRALLKRYATPAYLGVEITDALSGGARVERVIDGSPAGKAGLKAGDVIIAIDGDEITSAEGMLATMKAYSPGQKVTLGVVRRKPPAFQSALRSVSVTLGVRPGQAAPRYSLPYPDSYWYVYVAHTESEALARGGVHCTRP